jgi:hypothetical protein
LWRFPDHNVGKWHIKTRETSLVLYQWPIKNIDKARLVTVRATVFILLQKSTVAVRCRDSYQCKRRSLGLDSG